MKHRYVLRSIESSDLIGLYPDQESALDVVRGAIGKHGADQLASVALARIRLRDGEWPIAVGPELVMLARSVPAGPPRGRRAHPRPAGVKVVAIRGRVARRSKVMV